MQTGDAKLASVRTMDIVVAIALLLVAAIVITDSIRLGVGWREAEGPTAGYFPFYIALLLAVASFVNLVRAWTDRGPGDQTFVTRSAIRRVLSGTPAIRGLRLRTQFHRDLCGFNALHRALHVVIRAVFARTKHGRRPGDRRGPVPDVRSVVPRAASKGTDRTLLGLLARRETCVFFTRARSSRRGPRLRPEPCSRNSRSSSARHSTTTNSRRYFGWDRSRRNAQPTFVDPPNPTSSRRTSSPRSECRRHWIQ